MNGSHSVSPHKGPVYSPGRHHIQRRIVKSLPYYALILLPLCYLIIFKYYPMYGVQIAFREFSASKGILGSPWAGLKYFKMFWEASSRNIVIGNTLILSIYSLLASFPIPIILAICLNEARSKKFRKTVQMVTYMPYFISTVVLVSLIFQFSDPTTGIVNHFIKALGGKSVNIMGEASYFRHLFVWTGVWQTTGYSAVVYLAALSGVNTELYDAALVDGANKWQRIWNIDLPSILPTIMTLFILNTGSILSVGFEKVYLLQNSINNQYSEVISTYVYKIGMQSLNFSFSTAVGLFNSVVNLVMLVLCNGLARRATGTGLW